MAQIYGELIRAQLQSSASDLTPTAPGLVYFNTTTGLKWYTGSAWKVAVDLDSTQTLAGKTLDSTCNINAGALPITTLAKGGLGADASAWSGFVKIASGSASAVSIGLSDLPLITPSKGGTGVANNDAATLTRSGNHALTLTTTATTSLTLPTTGTVATLADITASNLTGTLATSKGGTGVNSTATYPTSGTVAVLADISAANLSGILASTKGGTGVNNAGTLTYGANNITLTTSGATSLTLPASGTMATLAGAEQLTNKDIDGVTASNTSRITLPKASKATLDGLTRKQATLVYGSDTNKVYADDGSTLKEIGSGSSGINYLSAQYAADALGTVTLSVGDVLASSTRSNPTQWGNSAASALITQSTDSTLRGTTNYLVAYTANAQFVESPLFSIDGEDLGKPLLVQFDVSGVSTADDVQVYIARYNSSNVLQERILIAGTASATTPNSAQVPTGVTTFKGFFIPSATATDKYAIRWLRNANNTSMRLDTLFVGPQSLAQGAIVTQATNFTFTPNGSHTWATKSCFYRRVGDRAELNIFAEITAGSPGSGTFTITLPSNLTITAGTYAAGIMTQYTTVLTGNNPAAVAAYIIADGTNVIKLGTAMWRSPMDLVDFAYATNSKVMTLSINTFVPVTTWSSGTTTLADRAVEEYAYNTNTTTSTNTSAFGYGTDGVAFPSSTAAAAFTKTVQFQTPVLPTDSIILEIKPTATSQWQPLTADNSATSNIMPTVSQGGTRYGVAISDTTSTTAVVRFEQYCRVGNTYNAAGGNWDAVTGVAKWRVRKVSGGAAVGFPVSARNIVGDVTGTAVPAGYVGEKITWASAPSDLTLTNSLADWTNASITLSAGTWLVIANINCYGSTQAVSGTAQTITVNLTDSANTLIQNQDKSIYIKTPTAAQTDVQSYIPLQAIVNVASSTTYKLRGKAQFVTGTATGKLFNSATQYSDFYAIRIA